MVRTEKRKHLFRHTRARTPLCCVAAKDNERATCLCVGSAAAQFQPNRLSLASKKSQNPLQCHPSHQITLCSLRLLSGFQGWWSLPLLICIEIACSNTEMVAQVWPGNSMSTHPCLLLFHQLIKLEVEAAFFFTGGACFWVSALKGWSVRKNSSSPRRAGGRQPRMENGADF